MCHPLGEEKLWAHRVFVTLARDLARAGFVVVRFDVRGEGDSDRDFLDSDFESRVEDTGLIADTVYRWYPSVAEINLLGLRFGASVAAETAARRNDVARLLLWDPVIDGAAYMQSVLRLNLMAQIAQHRKIVENREALVARLAQGGTVNIEGYELGEALHRQTSAFHLRDALARFEGDSLLVQIDYAENPINPELEALTKGHPGRHLASAREEPFWREIRAFYQRATDLTRATLAALGSTP